MAKERGWTVWGEERSRIYDDDIMLWVDGWMEIMEGKYEQFNSGGCYEYIELKLSRRSIFPKY